MPLRDGMSCLAVALAALDPTRSPSSRRSLRSVMRQLADCRRCGTAWVASLCLSLRSIQHARHPHADPSAARSVRRDRVM